MKEFQIPKLDNKSWSNLQEYLDGLSKKLNVLDSKCSCKELNDCHILLGLIDMVLGREYTIDEAFDKIKKESIDKQTITDIWVVCSGYKVLLDNPSQSIGLINHYQCNNGFKDYNFCASEMDKLFYTREEAIEYCKENFDSYDLIDQKMPDVIAFNNIGDDYE